MYFQVDGSEKQERCWKKTVAKSVSLGHHQIGLNVWVPLRGLLGEQGLVTGQTCLLMAIRMFDIHSSSALWSLRRLGFAHQALWTFSPFICIIFVYLSLWLLFVFIYFYWVDFTYPNFIGFFFSDRLFPISSLVKVKCGNFLNLKCLRTLRITEDHYLRQSTTPEVTSFYQLIHVWYCGVHRCPPPLGFSNIPIAINQCVQGPT